VLQAEDVVRVARGQSALLLQPTTAVRVSIADPRIADAVVINPREVLVNGIALGTTTLIIWDQGTCGVSTPWRSAPTPPRCSAPCRRSFPASRSASPRAAPR
jgi:Flp pilus assembly secretin CpaC